MSDNANDRSSAVATADEIRHLAGPVSDHTLTGILALQPGLREVEIAVAHVSGSASESGVPASALSDIGARIVEILYADETFQADDEDYRA